MKTTIDRLRPPPPTPEPLRESQAAVNSVARSTAIHCPGWDQDERQTVLPKPGPVSMVVFDGLRPPPPALNPLCVKEAAVNRAGPVPSSSSPSPSPLGPPPPPISYRGGDRGGGGRMAESALANRLRFCVSTFSTDGRGARVIPARTPPIQPVPT
jgi:hypothetical protein